MKSVLAVIRREFLQRVRTLAFVLSTIAVPLIMVGTIVIPALLASRGVFDSSERVVAIVDRTERLAIRVGEGLEGAGFTVEQVATSPSVEQELELRVSEGGIEGFLLLDAATLSEGRASFHTGSSLSPIRSLGIRQAVTQAALEARLAGTDLEARGHDVSALLSGGSLDVHRLNEAEGGASEGESAFLFAFIGTFILYIVIIVYAVAVLRAVMEEKTGRIVEIIVSSMRPSQLMLGKILGVGAVGLAQLAIWAVAGAGILFLGLPYLVAAVPQANIPPIGDVLPSLGLVGLWGLFFLLGYFLYASLYAAIGAMCTSEEEVQQVQFPVVLLLVVPFIFAQAIIESPDSTLAVSLSLVPFFTPLLMFARVAAGTVPLWQVILSLVMMVAAIGAVAWLAGRIYRVGILMQGKRPTVPELWRWVRQS